MSRSTALSQTCDLYDASIFEERKSGLTIRLNFAGSACASSRLKHSSSARVFSLIGFGCLDRFFRTLEAWCVQISASTALSA
jgi:hypothetical protein